MKSSWGYHVPIYSRVFSRPTDQAMIPLTRVHPDATNIFMNGENETPREDNSLVNSASASHTIPASFWET